MGAQDVRADAPADGGLPHRSGGRRPAGGGWTAPGEGRRLRAVRVRSLKERRKDRTWAPDQACAWLPVRDEGVCHPQGLRGHPRPGRTGASSFAPCPSPPERGASCAKPSASLVRRSLARSGSPSIQASSQAQQGGSPRRSSPPQSLQPQPIAGATRPSPVLSRSLISGRMRTSSGCGSLSRLSIRVMRRATDWRARSPDG